MPCLLYRGVKPGDRYVSVICGNTKRKTAVTENMSDFACAEVFHFLVKGAKSAVVEVLLKEKENIGNDKCLGSFKVWQRTWERFLERETRCAVSFYATYERSFALS